MRFRLRGHSKNGTPQIRSKFSIPTRDENNALLAVAVDPANGNPMNPTIEAFYNNPYIEKGATKTTTPYIGGPCPAGTFLEEIVDGQMVTYVDVPVDVPYTFRIMQTSHSRSFDRSIATITYIDQLPTYEAVENGTLVTKQAVINLETSQGWSYYDPITEAPTDQVTGYGIVTVPNYNANYAYSYPTLNLQFPGGIKDQTVDNSVTAYLTPVNKPDSEPIIEITDHVPIFLSY